MSRRHLAVAAVFFGIAYAVASALRGQVLSGVVTGMLGALLLFIVLVRVQQHNAEVRRRRK